MGGFLTKTWYFLVVLLIIGLVFFEYANQPYGYFSFDMLDNPGRFENQKMQIRGTFINSSNDHFYAEFEDRPLKIYYSGVSPPKLGEIVVSGIIRKGFVQGTDFHNYDYNYILYVFSSLAAVIFVLILFKEWKLTKRGFENA